MKRLNKVVRFLATSFYGIVTAIAFIAGLVVLIGFFSGCGDLEAGDGYEEPTPTMVGTAPTVNVEFSPTAPGTAIIPPPVMVTDVGTVKKPEPDLVIVRSYNQANVTVNDPGQDVSMSFDLLARTEVMVEQLRFTSPDGTLLPEGDVAEGVFTNTTMENNLWSGTYILLEPLRLTAGEQRQITFSMKLWWKAYPTPGTSVNFTIEKMLASRKDGTPAWVVGLPATSRLITVSNPCSESEGLEQLTICRFRTIRSTPSTTYVRWCTNRSARGVVGYTPELPPIPSYAATAIAVPDYEWCHEVMIPTLDRERPYAFYVSAFDEAYAQINCDGLSSRDEYRACNAERDQHAAHQTPRVIEAWSGEVADTILPTITNVRIERMRGEEALRVSFDLDEPLHAVVSLVACTQIPTSGRYYALMEWQHSIVTAPTRHPDVEIGPAVNMFNDRVLDAEGREQWRHGLDQYRCVRILAADPSGNLTDSGLIPVSSP